MPRGVHGLRQTLIELQDHRARLELAVHGGVVQGGLPKPVLAFERVLSVLPQQMQIVGLALLRGDVRRREVIDLSLGLPALFVPVNRYFEYQ